jgi:hypothetical protein
VFGNGRLPQNLSFSYDNLNLEIVKNFNYLGIIFTRTGNFSLTKKHLADKAQYIRILCLFTNYKSCPVTYGSDFNINIHRVSP